MNQNIDLNKIDLKEFKSENILTTELVSKLLLNLKNIPKFNESYVLSKPYNFNFQTTIDGVHKSDYGTILSFFKKSDGIYAALNNKLEKNTNIMLNILIEKIHLNIIGKIEQLHDTGTDNVYIAEITFKNLSTQDKNNIFQIVSGKQDAGARMEKREHLRLQKNIPVTYQIYTNINVLNEHAALVYTIDISQAGVKIASSEELHVNNMLYMQIPFKNNTLYCAGKVIWVDYSKEANKYLAGIKFTDISADTKEKLLELVLS